MRDEQEEQLEQKRLVGSSPTGRKKYPSPSGEIWNSLKCHTGPERATLTPNGPEPRSAVLLMMPSMVEICSSWRFSFLGAWRKSMTAHPGLGRLRLDARFSVWPLGGRAPSQSLPQVAAMPQKEGSSECEDPSELPSDGESLNRGGSNLLVRGAGSEGRGAPLHTIPPLNSLGLTCKDARSVSTFSTSFTFRRLFCVGRNI